jgi:hypothetical protein
MIPKPGWNRFRFWEIVVRKKKAKAGGGSVRRKLSAEESLQRMKEFDKRKEAFVAALRKSKDRGVSS